MNDPTKVRNGSWVGRVELGGRVGDLDPSLLNSRNLSWVGQVGQVEFGGRVNDLDPSAPFCEPYCGGVQFASDPPPLFLRLVIVRSHISFAQQSVQVQGIHPESSLWQVGKNFVYYR